MSIIVVSNNQSVWSGSLHKVNDPAEYRLPAGRKFGYLLNNFEYRGVSRPTQKKNKPKVLGLPDTEKMLKARFTPLSYDWQHYWVDLFALRKYGKLYDDLTDAETAVINLAFKGVTRGDAAFTNGRSREQGYADYINGVNIGAKPMEQETIDTGGNILELVGDLTRLRIGKMVPCYPVATLDGTRPPPDPRTVNDRETPWLVFRATISRREGYNQKTGKWAREDLEIPFDQLGGVDVPIPFLGVGTVNYVDASRIRVLPESALLPAIYRF